MLFSRLQSNQHNTLIFLASSLHIFQIGRCRPQLHFLQLKEDRHLHFKGEGTGLLQT